MVGPRLKRSNNSDVKNFWHASDSRINGWVKEVSVIYWLLLLFLPHSIFFRICVELEPVLQAKPIYALDNERHGWAMLFWNLTQANTGSIFKQ